MLNIQKDVSLLKYTTFRIGGTADFFIEVKSFDELKEALTFAAGNGLSFFILGGGSNVLVSDNGFKGLVIKIKINEINLDLENNSIIVSAGTFLASLVKKSVENGLAGLEWAAGIPGTVGGAIRGNAGAFSRMTGESIESVEVYDVSQKKLQTHSAEDCMFGYRDSLFKHNPNLIIISAKFKFTPGKKEELEKKTKEIIGQRISKQPHGMGSAGSYFMNPVVKNTGLIERFETEKKAIARGNKLPAGWIIQEAGLKGKKIGGAIVSETHGDFILNAGGATAEDVIILESYIKQQVRDQFGVELVSEVQKIGF